MYDPVFLCKIIWCYWIKLIIFEVLTLFVQFLNFYITVHMEVTFITKIILVLSDYLIRYPAGYPVICCRKKDFSQNFYYNAIWVCLNVRPNVHIYVRQSVIYLNEMLLTYYHSTNKLCFCLFCQGFLLSNIKHQIARCPDG